MNSLFWGVVIGILIGLFVIGSPKYEGENAEYWYSSYADYEYLARQRDGCLDKILNTAEYNSYSSTYEEMEEALVEIADTADSCN